ncbi:hypothetical protein SAMN02745146_0803 [Hymenobacter daecheongensis DSM 21074]|uniref:DUF6970 domain-containing protein n=1 Tax=Hymenobacter daecheongensis DSM 21074 TaxID=1121955 RepID=A0A1M6AXM7_9BACT|nr:hypothetical protein [Hymenobacter daecheongensis]SHI41202.1 hypothetical protein SAMN02745146_0803 [Hymenobacter daecheongensis DSM 21074]
MRPTLFFAVSSAALLLTGACQRGVAVTTPTDAPVSGSVSGPDTPNPTSANTTNLTRNRPAAFDTTARPRWLEARIQSHLAEPKLNPPIHIYRYRYNGEAVYFETAPCCDQFSTVYDAKGKVLCHPDGGITGRGDGNCADFTKKRTAEMLVWQDPR